MAEQSNNPPAGAVGSPGQPPAPPTPPAPPAPHGGGTGAAPSPREGVPQVGGTVALTPGQGEPDRPETRGIAGGLAGTLPEHRDARGILTRTGMESVIKEGGSVLYKGRTIARVEDLPNETELAGGNPLALETAKRHLSQRRAALDAEEAQLREQERDAQEQRQPPRQAGQAAEGGASGTRGGNDPTGRAQGGGGGGGTGKSGNK